MVHSHNDGLHPPPAPILQRADDSPDYRPPASRGLRAPTADASRQVQQSWACLGPAPPTTLVGSPRFRQFPDRTLSRSDALAPEPSYPTPPFPSRSSGGLLFPALPTTLVWYARLPEFPCRSQARSGALAPDPPYTAPPFPSFHPPACLPTPPPPRLVGISPRSLSLASAHTRHRRSLLPLSWRSAVAVA